ncbi:MULTISPECIES: hypothetical protein [unclassified Streptomyces]|uniref:hypothetical protein n=1 Tax=unclassified Streptomyces TaxID=2593676 RepID=UPI0035E19C49
MPAEPAQAALRARLLWYFTETLGALPPELALALRHPDLPKAAFHDGVTLPSNDDPDHPLDFFDIRYWILGTTPDTSDRYYDLTLRVWKGQGWTIETDRDSRPRGCGTRTPDGYGFALTQSVNGYLSLSGMTPPFAADSATGSPFPTRIDHPSDVLG